MVVVALRGSNIPALPISEHNSAFFSEDDLPAWEQMKHFGEMRRMPLTPNLSPTAPRQGERWRPFWSINETE